MIERSRTHSCPMLNQLFPVNLIQPLHPHIISLGRANQFLNVSFSFFNAFNSTNVLGSKADGETAVVLLELPATGDSPSSNADPLAQKDILTFQPSRKCECLHGCQLRRGWMMSAGTTCTATKFIEIQGSPQSFEKFPQRASSKQHWLGESDERRDS